MSHDLIVMAAVADPVATGFVASLARPGGNILKTAKALGLTIPPSLLVQADHVVE